MAATLSDTAALVCDRLVAMTDDSAWVEGEKYDGGPEEAAVPGVAVTAQDNPKVWSVGRRTWTIISLRRSRTFATASARTGSFR